MPATSAVPCRGCSRSVPAGVFPAMDAHNDAVFDKQDTWSVLEATAAAGALRIRVPVAGYFFA